MPILPDLPLPPRVVLAIAKGAFHIGLGIVTILMALIDPDDPT